MDKMPLVIPQQDGKWGSYVSKYPADDDQVPNNGFTRGTQNVVTSIDGTAQKRLGDLLWQTCTNSPADQYEGVLTNGERLFIINDGGTIKASIGGPFTSITSGYTSPSNFEFVTYQDRVYFDNGIDAPQVLDTVASYGGVTYSFSVAKTKVMGCQVPATACTATLNLDSTADQVPAGAHTYKITFVYYNGAEESNGSTASSPVTNDGTHTSTDLSSIPIGGYGVTARNIYRDDNDGNWLLLDFINDNTTTTYSDILSIGSTPIPIPIANDLPPIFSYSALFLDRIFVIDYLGKNIYWSNAGQPDIFNPANAISGPQDDTLTAIHVFNGIPFVFGQHTVGQILGNTDSSFYYSPLSTKTGCIDNRSIQERSLVSTPTLMWLASTPNKGIYYTNGWTIQYMSDAIEDLTFNLAQIQYFTERNTEDSQAEFQSGTYSPGIDLLSNPGTIQTINPSAFYGTAAEWATGTLSNLAQIGDQLTVPTQFNPVDTAGLFGGVAEDDGSGNITLPASTDFTGQSNLSLAGAELNTATASYVAEQFTPVRSGTVTSISIGIVNSSGGGINWNFEIWSNNVAVPGSKLEGQTVSVPNGTNICTSGAFATVLTAGTAYWIVAYVPPQDTIYFNADDGSYPLGSTSPGFAGSSGVCLFSAFHPTSLTWTQVPAHGGGDILALYAAYTFAVTPDVSSGTWTSPVYNSYCDTQTSGMELTQISSYPSPSSATITVQGSPDGISWTVTDTIPSLNGTYDLTGGQYQYWQILITLQTLDDRYVPILGQPNLTFATTGTWISPAILCTTDITTLDSLVAGIVLPPGTSYELDIATSADNVTYSSYSGLGAATPAEYAKIRLILTTDGGDSVTPSVSSTELDWTVVSTFLSEAIDTGIVPNGWQPFVYEELAPGAGVTVSFASADSESNLSSATFYPTLSGAFPTAPSLEWVQWSIVMSATANNIPQIDSVTVAWNIGNGIDIRCASLFFNKSYYLAVALAGSPTNNVVIELDNQNNWRLHMGESFSTLGLYYNNPYGGDAGVGNVYSLFTGLTDNGTPITMDLRTKCFDYQDTQRLKIIRSLKVKGVNSGTTIHVYYSTDRGNSWNEMLNSSGTMGYTTGTDGLEYTEYFIPVSDGSVPMSGRTLLYRIVSSDAFPCSILQVMPVVYRRKGKAISEAGVNI